VATKNKVFDSTKGLEVLIATNDLLQPTYYYMLTLRLKEKVIYQEELQLKKSSTRTVKILPKVALAGTVGGVLTLNLYRINQSYYTYQVYDEKKFATTVKKATVTGWLEPRGEILVMMKPDKSLEVTINLEKQTYQPGDLVNYEI
jgi:hypothetical protein